MKILPHIYYRPIEGKGRGMFTALDIEPGSLIEICPLILIPVTQSAFIDKTEIYNYYFLWNDEFIALALGYGSLYNHSNHPNAKVIFDYESQEIQFEANRLIQEGEEILIDYLDGDPGLKVWFAEH